MTIGTSVALPGLIFEEVLEPSGLPRGGIPGVAMRLGDMEMFLNSYKLRELKALVVLSERAIERQQEKQFLANNLTLDI